jgi:hypothetical protein
VIPERQLYGDIANVSRTLKVLVASFLTIAASGLFTTAPIVHQRPVNLTRMDSFFDPTNMTSQFSGTFNSTTQIAARLVVYNRTNSPAWTFGQYAIPTLSTSANATKEVDSTTLINAHFPVRRGYLTCELVPQDQVYLNYTLWDNRISTGKNDIGVQVRWEMLNQYNCTSSKTNGKSNGESIVGPEDGFFSQWVDDDDLSSEKNVSLCPTSYGVYGTWQGRRAKELNVVLCWGSIQELQASAQFSMPGWKVQALVADESTAKNVSSGPETQLNMLKNMFGGLLKAQSTSSIDPVFSGFLRNSTSNKNDLYLLHSENFSELYARMQDAYSRATVRSYRDCLRVLSPSEHFPSQNARSCVSVSYLNNILTKPPSLGTNYEPTRSIHQPHNHQYHNRRYSHGLCYISSETKPHIDSHSSGFAHCHDHMRPGFVIHNQT